MSRKGNCRQNTEYRRQETEDRRQKAGDRRQERVRGLETKDRRQETACCVERCGMNKFSYPRLTSGVTKNTFTKISNTDLSFILSPSSNTCW